MTLKSTLNVTAVLLSVITGLVGVVAFFLVSFYSTAQAQWKESGDFRTAAEARLHAIELESRMQRESVAKDISAIKDTLSKIVEVKLRREPPA